MVWFLEYAVIALNIVLVLSILTTCLTYIIIRAHLKRSPQIFNSDERQNLERNVKLSKTVFLVIALSFACWVPAIILYVIHYVFCKECIPAEVVLVGTVLHFANSLVNPIAYTCRLSVFKKTLNRLLKRRQVRVEITKLWKKNVPCLAWPKKLFLFGPDVWHALLSWFSNRTGTSFDDWRARGKDQTRLPVSNLPLSHWSSQSFDLRAPSSTGVPFCC